MKKIQILSLEELNYLKTLVDIDVTDNTNDFLLSLYYINAENSMIKARFPFNNATNEEIENAKKMYSDNVDRAFVDKWNRRGADNQTSHTENGVSRTFIDYSNYFQDIVGKCKVLK